MGKEKIGTIGNHTIYADMGRDYASELLAHIKKQLEGRKLKAGDKLMLPFNFDFSEGHLVAEITIRKIPGAES